MNDKQRQVLEGLIAGKTYREIATEMNLTFQRCHQLAQEAIRGQRTGRRGPRAVKCMAFQVLYEWLLSHNMTCQALAKETGIHPVVLSKLFHGKSRGRIGTLVKISNYTWIPIEELARSSAREDESGDSDD